MKDFLCLLNVFVSSDGESVAAGEQWLTSIETALAECDLLITLCSPHSIRRPWINFEAGAAWMQKIPLIRVCHGGLAPSDLPMPLSLRQGISLVEPEGLRRLYSQIARVLNCQAPHSDFRTLAGELLKSPTTIFRDILARGRWSRASVVRVFRPRLSVSFDGAVQPHLDQM